MVFDMGKSRKINVNWYGKPQKNQCFLVWETPEKTVFLDMRNPRKNSVY